MLILFGPTGTGKTELAKSLVGGTPLLITHLDDLKNWDPDLYAGLVYDEVYLLQRPREEQIIHCTLDHNVTTHARYSNAYLTKGRLVIFTTNRMPTDIILFNDPAIRRRVQLVYVRALGDYEPVPLGDDVPASIQRERRSWRSRWWGAHHY